MGLDKKDIYKKIANKKLTVQEGKRLLEQLEQTSKLESTSPTENQISKKLIEILASAVNKQTTEIKSEVGFYEQGLDSNDLLNYVKALEKELGEELYPTLLFEYTTIDKLSEFINTEYPGKLTEASIQTITQPTNIDSIIEQELKSMFSKYISKSPDKINITDGFYEQGLDSNDLLKFVKELENRLEEELYPTLLFEYTNIQELSTFLKENYSNKFNIETKTDTIKKESISTGESTKITPTNKVISKNVEELQESTKTPQKDVAIIGLSGRYPQADDIYQFWENLKAGRDCITEIPEERWDHSKYFNPDKNHKGTTYSKWGGFINDVDKFDPLFFNISPREATLMDPQERLFLEECWKVIEDAGYRRENLGTDKVGVFAGVMYGDYQLFGLDESQSEKPNAFYASVSNRVSYYFNFYGPSIALDTMCSSSLTTIHLAYKSILNGECDMAIAGGVNVTIHPNKYLRLSQQNFLSSDGRCRAFGKDGDGYVPGEGVGAVLLKPLDKAIEDKDYIYGVIKGSAINHGGKASGATVPNPNAQAELIMDAIEDSGVAPETISYLEAHGTGTSLGDPIEIAGLTKAYKKYTNKKQYCPIGSVKSNIGHLESAAGISGITKLLLQLKYKKLVPSIHSDEVNPNINLKASPFYVQHKLGEWNRPIINEKEYPRRAGISGFGAGGSNAHIILEEHENITTNKSVEQKHLVVISAKTEESLRAYARSLIDFVSIKKYELGNVAYTLSTGKENMRYRLAIVSNSIKDLVNRLREFLDNSDKSSFFTGEVKDDKEGDYDINSLIAKRELGKLAKLWCEGRGVDWSQLYQKDIYNKVNLPTYNFKKQYFWVKSNEKEQGSILKQKLHPLIDENISTLEAQLFFLTLDSKKFYIKDHKVSDDGIFPGAAYIEMARAAAELSSGKSVTSIENIFWHTPFIVNDSSGKELFISLFPNSENEIEYEIFTKSNEKKVINSTGMIYFTEKIKEQSINIEDKKGLLPEVIDKESFYQKFLEKGLFYGNTFRNIQEIRANETEALTMVEQPLDIKATKDFTLSPALLDNALQSIGGLLLNEDKLYLPFSLDSVTIHSSLTTSCYINVLKSNSESDIVNQKSFNINVYSNTGNILVSIKGFKVRAYTKTINTVKVDKMYIKPRWIERPLSSTKEKKVLTNVIIFDKNSALYDKMRNISDKVILITEGNEYKKINSEHFEIAQASEKDYVKLIAELQNKSLFPEYIINNWCMDESFSSELTKSEDQINKSYISLLLLCKTLMLNKIKNKIKILFTYSSDNPLYSSIASFANTLSLENANYQCKAIKIDQAKMIKSPQILVDEFFVKGAKEISYSEGIRKVKVLDELKLKSKGPFTNLKSDGVYIITGGLGGLGLIFANYLAKQVAPTLILTGRSELTRQKSKEIEKISSTGSVVDYFRSDITNREDVQKLVKAIKSKYKKVTGIIHSAGIKQDSYIIKKNYNEAYRVIAPKIKGTINLDEATKDEKLDFFITFSSLAAFGNAGQSDYAYANSFTDHYIDYRNSLVKNGKRTGKGLSINWPLWKKGGMQIDSQAEKLMEQSSGLRPLSTEVGIEGFITGLSLPNSQFAILEGNRNKIYKTFNIEGAIKHKSDEKTSRSNNKVPSDLSSELIRVISELLMLNSDDIEQDTDFSELGFDSVTFTELANKINEKYNTDITPAIFYEYSNITNIAQYLSKQIIFIETKPEMSTDRAGMKKHIEQGLIESIANVLELSIEDIDPETDLSEYGFDSVTFTELANKLNETFSLEVTPALFYEYSNIEALKLFIEENYNMDANKVKSSSSQKEKTVSNEKRERFFSYSKEKKINDLVMHEEKKEVAIIGLYGKFPGSNNPEEFWQHLVNGEDLISEVPSERWEWENYFDETNELPNKTNSKWGGFIDDIDKFDASFFKISPREAELMDPQHRIFLETVWHTIEDAGYKPSMLSGSNTGIFVGVGNNDYYGLINDDKIDIEGYTSTGNSHSVLPNRISYLLNLHGPSEPIDTACSSALVAIHRAVQSIQSNSCDLAIAGGVNSLLSPKLYISFGKAGMLSPDGRCKTFDKSANGYVRGEGVGAILLKPLAKAKKDGDHIYAIIKGTAENHGGRAKSLTAPNPNAQASLIIDAMNKAKVSPDSISYIEAHGTGTSLGDPIEINALKKAYSELYHKWKLKVPENPHCAISSVKTNIGHLETAAGIAGIIKVLLAMKYEKIPGNIHFNELNPYIKLEGSPFYIASQNIGWKNISRKGKVIPRRAAVSSFGFGGVNSHIVLEEYTRNKTYKIQSTEGVFVLSAKSKEQLKEYIETLLNYLEKNKTINLHSLLYTLQTGREEYDFRFATTVSNIDELIYKIKLFLNNTSNNHNIFTGQCNKKDNNSLNSSNKKNIEIAQKWSTGTQINWTNYTTNINRVALPGYPFKKDSYWYKKESPTSSNISNNKTFNSLHKNEIMNRLINIIESLLKYPAKKIIKTDNYLDYGFDSITLNEFINQLKRTFNIEISPSELIDNSTLNELALYIKKQKKLNPPQHKIIAPKNNKTKTIKLIGTMNNMFKPKNYNKKWLTPPKNKIISNKKALNTLLEKNKIVRLLIKTILCDKVEVIISGRGKPLIIIPGLGMTAASWHKQIKDLSKNFMTITIHTPGHGLSAAIEDINFKIICQIFNEIQNTLEIKKAHWCSTSFGGLILLHYAVYFPDNLTSLSLIGTPYYYENLEYENNNSLEKNVNRDFDNIIAHSNNTSLFEKQRKYKKQIMKSESINPIMAIKYAETILKSSSALNILPKIKCPTAIIHGKYDALINPEQALIINKKIKKSKYYELNTGGHFPGITHAKLLNKIIRNFINHHKV